MARRIEIELTSKLSENEWTWRAAGAKQPKGVVGSGVLYEGAKVGDVVKAEAEFEVDGITLLSVTRPAGAKPEAANRLTITGPERKFEPVTSTLAPKGKGRPPRRGDGERPGRRPSSDRPREDRKDRSDRKDRNEARRGSPRPERTDRSARPQRQRPEPRPAFKRLQPGDEHRNKVLEQVPEEQRPIAERVLRGGIPAVRQAVEAENAKAKSEGRAEMNGPALVTLAESLLPQLKAAEWMDRATAAKAQVNEISVRDLRTVVSGADAVARTEEARLLASELREALDRRSAEAREQWLNDLRSALTEGRIVRALKLSSRPPDAQVKFPAELQEQLEKATAEAMAPDTPPDRWLMLLEAVSDSPVRRTVVPAGLPPEPGEALLTAAKAAAGRVPALAKQLGVTMPPPPRRRTPPPPPKPVAASEGEPSSAQPPSEAAVHDDEPSTEA